MSKYWEIWYSLWKLAASSYTNFFQQQKQTHVCVGINESKMLWCQQGNRTENENTVVQKCHLEEKGLTWTSFKYHFFANLKCFIKWLDLAVFTNFFTYIFPQINEDKSRLYRDTTRFGFDVLFSVWQFF